jgi:hypothetical protein
MTIKVHPVTTTAPVVVDTAAVPDVKEATPVIHQSKIKQQRLKLNSNIKLKHNKA